MCQKCVHSGQIFPARQTIPRNFWVTQVKVTYAALHTNAVSLNFKIAVVLELQLIKLNFIVPPNVCLDLENKPFTVRLILTC